ncbi:uncharacterized protein [Nicotiana tomentosiformis]|uniref:uncharacterized protein n=1 Tax=Nicotiana tomentosiformis TaxID=4098 RepID=UPI00388C64D7
MVYGSDSTNVGNQEHHVDMDELTKIMQMCWDFLVPMDIDYKPKVDWDTNCNVIRLLKENLTKTEVHHEVKNEMRFVVSDSRLRFDLDEFALVTGLKCKGDTSIESVLENRLISKYFGTAFVTLAKLVDCFTKKKWETNDDALKIAVLYFLNIFLLSLLKTKIWLYECCPSLDGHFADHIGNNLPQILNWVVKGQIQNERVALRMFRLQREQNITPTVTEKQLFDMRGLNFEIEVDCTDSQPDNFQIFGTQLPKTQSMHQSTGGDSEPANAEHKQQDNDPYFGEMHTDYDQFERGDNGNDPVVIGDSTPEAPSMFGFGGVGREGGASGVNEKNVTIRHVIVNDDLRSAPFVNEHDLGLDSNFGHDISLDSNFELSASAIDQIIAITQHVKYKQPSHDVKKSGPALLPSRIPAQTRLDVIIESKALPLLQNTAPWDTIVDVTNSEVSPYRHEGDLGLDSVYEYTESQLDLIAAITQRGRRTVNQSRNELTTHDVNKCKSNQSVSRTVVQTRTDVEKTHAVFTRRRRPTAVKQSPYRNDWQSGVSAVRGSLKVIKIDDKTLFHTLNYSSRPLSSSHLNIIIYYLMKKAKYEINMPIKVTTTYTLFNNIIQRVYTEFVKGGKQDHLIDRSGDIMEYMKGFRMHCNTPWHQVDHVLFPINLAEKWHWILGDCGVYVACFAEYIIEGLPIHVANFDVDALRARFGKLLWHYGRNKKLHVESKKFCADFALMYQLYSAKILVQWQYHLRRDMFWNLTHCFIRQKVYWYLICFQQVVYAVVI